MRITIVMITRTFYTNSVSLGYFLNIAHSQMDIHMFRSFFTSNFTCYADCIFWGNFNLSKNMWRNINHHCSCIVRKLISVSFKMLYNFPF